MAKGADYHQPQELLPHQALVEDVIGTPLFPQHTAYELGTDPTRPDIRVTVHGLVSTAVAQVMQQEVSSLPRGPLEPGELQRVRSNINDLLLQAGRQVIIANNVADSLQRPAFSPPAADASHTQRSLLQSAMGQALYGFVQQPHPLKMPELGDQGPLAPLQSGLLLASATGTGKSVPVAELGARAGIGERFSELDNEQNSMLIVVPSMDLLDEYLDPDGTLRQWLPGIEVGEYSHRRKQTGGAVDIILNDSVGKAISSRAIELARYPIRVIDEGHHARAPRLLGQMGGLAAGRLILCTATPREMRRVFVDFTASTPRSAAEQGITRPVRLMTYQYGPEEGAAEKLMAKLAAKVIESGKQVAIYCRVVKDRPGAHQAKEVARLINAMSLEVPEGSGWEWGDYVRVVAGVEGTDENDRNKADYKAGKLRGYVVVGMLKEGTNMPMDALIVHPGYSQDELDQVAGRLPRPLLGSANPYKEGLLIEVQPAEIPQARVPRATIWRTYGFDNNDSLEQGFRIGMPDEDDDESDDDLDFRPLPQQGAAGGPLPKARGKADDFGGLPPVPKPTLRRRYVESDWIETFLASSDLRLFLAAPNILLREVVIAPEDWLRYEGPPEGSERLTDLADLYDVPEIWLQRKLDALSGREGLVSADGLPITVTYKGIRRATEDNKRGEYERWYSAGAVLYLQENPPTPRAGGDLMAIADIADMCDVSDWYIDEIVKRLELPHEIRLGKVSKPTRYYDMPEIVTIIDEVNKTPIAAVDDEAVPDLCREMDTAFVQNIISVKRYGIEFEMRRRNPEHGIRGFARHVSAEGAAIIRDGFYNPKYATDQDISIADMARLAEVNLDGMYKRLARIPEDERPEITLLKLGEKGRVVSHMDRAKGLAIVEAMRLRKLPPNRFTIKMIEAYLFTGEMSIKNRVAQLAEQGHIRAQDAKPEHIILNSASRGVITWPWSVVQALEEVAGMSVRPGIEPIDYTLVSTSEFDPEWQYSQSVQARFIDRAKLSVLPPRSKVHRIGGRHQLSEGWISLDQYVASRGLRMATVLQAVAEDAFVDSALYYERDLDSGAVQYIVDGSDVRRFDHHFRPDLDQDADPQAPVEPIVVAAESLLGAVALAPSQAVDAIRAAGPDASSEAAEAPVEVAPDVIVVVDEPAQVVVPSVTEVSVEQEWRSAGEVFAALNCSRNAIGQLLVLAHARREQVRQDETGLFLTASLASAIGGVLKRAQSIGDGWMRHGRLAELAGVPEHELVGFMRRQGIHVGASDARVARVHGVSVSYDVVYSQNLWQRVVRVVKMSQMHRP